MILLITNTTTFADTTLNLTPENPVASTTPEISGVVEVTIEGQFLNGAEPLLNPTIKCVGENLFNKNNVADGLYANYVNGTLSISPTYSVSDYIEIKPNTQYYKSNESQQIAFYDSSKNFVSGMINPVDLFTTPSNATYVRITVLTSNLNIVQLTEGATPTTEYKPYNESSFTYNGWLGSGDKLIGYSGGKIEVQKNQALLILDGGLNWIFNLDFDGYKSVYVTGIPDDRSYEQPICSKFNDEILTFGRRDSGANILDREAWTSTSGTGVIISIEDTDSGWGENYIPTSDEIKAYFNGYVMYQAGGGLYTSGTKYFAKRYQDVGVKGYLATGIAIEDGSGTNQTTCPTTKAYGNDTKAYQLYYQLATPTTDTIATNTTFNTIAGEKNTISITSESGMFKSATITIPTLQDISGMTDEEIHTVLLKKIVALENTISTMNNTISQQQLEINNLKNGGTGTSFDSLNYQYDLNGNLTTITTN